MKRQVVVSALVILALFAICMFGCSKPPEELYANDRITQEEFITAYNDMANELMPSSVKKHFPEARFDIEVTSFDESFDADGVHYTVDICQKVDIGNADKIDWKSAWLSSRDSYLHKFKDESKVVDSLCSEHRTVEVNPTYTLLGSTVDGSNHLLFVDDEGNSYCVETWSIHKDDGKTHDEAWKKFDKSDLYGDTSSNTNSSNTKKPSSSSTSTKQKCLACNGTGYVKYYSGGAGSDYTYGTCTECKGTGYVRR